MDLLLAGSLETELARDLKSPRHHKLVHNNVRADLEGVLESLALLPPLVLPSSAMVGSCLARDAKVEAVRRPEGEWDSDLEIISD